MYIVQQVINGVPEPPVMTDIFGEARMYFTDVCNAQGINLPLPLTETNIPGLLEWVKDHIPAGANWDVNIWDYTQHGFGNNNNNANENQDKCYEFLRETIAYSDQTTDKRIYKFLREVNQIEAGFKPMFLEEGECLNEDGFWDEQKD